MISNIRLIVCLFLSYSKGSKQRARVIQLEEDLSNTRQKHRDAAQEVSTALVSN